MAKEAELPTHHIKAFADLVNRFDKAEVKQAFEGAPSANQQAIHSFLREQGLDPAKYGLKEVAKPAEPAIVDSPDLAEEETFQPSQITPK